MAQGPDARGPACHLRRSGPAKLTLQRPWVKTRLRRMQYRPELLAGFLASTGLDLGPFL